MKIFSLTILVDLSWVEEEEEEEASVSNLVFCFRGSSTRPHEIAYLKVG
jgi:hypothetical protein